MSHADKAFSSTSPAANASMIPTASTSGASRRYPFISRKELDTVREEEAHVQCGLRSSFGFHSNCEWVFPRIIRVIRKGEVQKITIQGGSV